MKVTMTDGKLTSLIKRCKEKEEQGYDYVTPIKKVNSSGVNYSKTYGGQFNYDGIDFSTKYKVVMEKAEGV